MGRWQCRMLYACINQGLTTLAPENALLADAKIVINTFTWFLNLIQFDLFAREDIIAWLAQNSRRAMQNWNKVWFHPDNYFCPIVLLCDPLFIIFIIFQNLSVEISAQMLVEGLGTNHGISSVGFSAMAKDSTTQQPGTFWSHPKCFDLSIRFIRVFAVEIQAVENLGIGDQCIS